MKISEGRRGVEVASIYMGLIVGRVTRDSEKSIVTEYCCQEYKYQKVFHVGKYYMY